VIDEDMMERIWKKRNKYFLVGNVNMIGGVRPN
jgi:hypothetical protein